MAPKLISSKVDLILDIWFITLSSPLVCLPLRGIVPGIVMPYQISNLMMSLAMCFGKSYNQKDVLVTYFVNVLFHSANLHSKKQVLSIFICTFIISDKYQYINNISLSRIILPYQYFSFLKLITNFVS